MAIFVPMELPDGQLKGRWSCLGSNVSGQFPFGEIDQPKSGYQEESKSKFS